MDKDSATPPRPGSGPPPDEPGDEQESGSPVGDTFEEGETEVGPYPSLINLENWEESDVASAAGTEDPGSADTTPDE